MSHLIIMYKESSSVRTILGTLTFLYSLCAVSFSLAQGTTSITPTTGIGDLGTTVKIDGRSVQITGGTRPSDGANLFHSFKQFNLGSGDIAQFLNATPSLTTSNILSRVTGNNPSSIFGTIDTMSYPGANLFFMNPAGIVFGPDATLNVGGSVAFTTADYLRLAEANGTNAGIFHADTTAASLFTSAPIAAFGFLNSNAAAIAVQGSTLDLRQPDQSFSLVGGNKGFRSANISVPNGVTITNSHLSATSGPIHIASVATQGEILTGTLEQAQNINGHSFGSLGTIQLSQSGLNANGAGFLIRGGRLIIDSSEVSASTGDISLDATSIRISNSTQIATVTETTANAGHIILSASRDITLDPEVVVASVSQGSTGHAGNITLNSMQGDVSIGNSSLVTSQANGKGNTGQLRIDSPNGNIRLNGAHVFTSVQGTGILGGILIEGNNLFMLNEASIVGNNFTTQVAKNIAIILKERLDITGNSAIETGAPGSAKAADLIVQSGDILITENSRLITSTTSFGQAGRLSLLTDNLKLADGGRLLSRSFVSESGEVPSGRGGIISIEGYKNPGTSITIDGPGSGIFTSAQGTGPAGNIDMKATSVTLQNGGKMSAETSGISSKATGGSIIINATDQVTLTNGGSITASSTGPADAGKIDINAGQQLDLTNGSSITTTTQSRQANGGNIDIRAIDRVRLVDSTISTSVKGAEGSGGNIFIDPKVVMLEGSNVTAQAVGGSGGNITFVTPLFLQDSASTVSATSQRGISGTVLIQSPTSNLSGTVGQLASKTNPPQVLLQNRCIALAGGEQSTFILAGRDALPSEPGGWLSSPVAMEHWTGEEKEHASGLMVRSLGSNGLSGMAALQDKSHDLSMRRLTPPGFLVRSFATGTTGCPS